MELTMSVSEGSEWGRVMAFGDDAFFPVGYHDIVRFEDKIKRNANKQPFDIVKEPLLSGKIVSIPLEYLIFKDKISIILDK